MLQDGLHVVTSRVLQASSPRLCILKSHSPNVTAIYQGGGQAPSQAESDETVQGAASSREMCHIPSLVSALSPFVSQQKEQMPGVKNRDPYCVPSWWLIQASK